MNRTVLNIIIRFVIILLLQVLVLKGVNLNSGNFQYFHLLFYPIVIMLLPISLAKPYVILIAFASGIFVDIFYDSIGVHAAACVFMAYTRSFVLQLLEPRGGYTYDIPGLGNTEFSWFITYISIMLLLFLLFYFSMEAFSTVFIVKIILNTFFSFILSIITILVYQVIFRTKS